MSAKRRLDEGEEGEGGAKVQKMNGSEGLACGDGGHPDFQLLAHPLPGDGGEEERCQAPSPKLAPATRISKRAVKARRGGGKPLVDDVVSEAEDGCKRRRTWELWGPNEKVIFFEALNEYGKDFDKIQLHFQAKLKNKRNMPAHYIKNKNQIRHFYYRTWHKISGYIHFTSELTKNSRELIGLINYGELWKKIGGTVDDKFGQKLNDLVQKGTAALKVKGKSQRVKTPVCRALKKVHSKGEVAALGVAKVKLPSKVLLELRPRSNTDWCRVQGLAQNPHVRVTLGSGRRLASLIRVLEKKWRGLEARLRQGLGGKEEDGEREDEGKLVLMPVRNAVIKEEEEVVVTEVKHRPKVKIKLAGLEDEGGGQEQDVEEGSKFEEMLGLQRKKDEQEGREEAGEANTSLDRMDSLSACDDNSNDEPAQHRDGVAQSPRLDIVEEEEEEPVGEAGEDFLLDLSDQECSRSPVQDLDYFEEVEEMEEDEEGVKEEEEPVKGDEYIKEEDIKDDDMKGEKEKDEGVEGKWSDPRAGWSGAGAGGLTVGELYCLLGGRQEEARLALDYTWRREEPAGQCSAVLSRLVRLAGAARLPTRGRSTSQSSPSVRGALSSPRLSSPLARGGLVLSPVGRPHTAGGAPKQLLLPAPPAAPQAKRSSSPLAVPLPPDEPEFRKPLAPAAARQGTMSAAFREQLNAMMPKFSNRRGRQNRNRAKQVVGRHLLQPLQPAPPPQVLQPLLLVQEVVATPSPQPTPPTLPPSIKGISPVQASPLSPPQISIPSPRRSPSPTPSFSCLMDLTFPESAPATPTKAGENFLLMYQGDGDISSSLLQTPPRPAPTPSPSRCLQDSQDLSLSSWSLR